MIWELQGAMKRWIALAVILLAGGVFGKGFIGIGPCAADFG